jgi:predicted nucleic acid-binding protein
MRLAAHQRQGQSPALRRPLVETSALQDLLHAIDIEKANKISFWDALIVAAAYSKNRTMILTEDLNHGQSIEGIAIYNPYSSD